MKCINCSKSAYNGIGRCTIDDAQTALHEREQYCPHPSGPMFGDGQKPDIWDSLAADPLPIPDDYDSEISPLSPKNPGCCGAPQQNE